MNGPASFGDERCMSGHCGAQSLAAARSQGRHDERNDGIRSSGRRDVGDLLPLDAEGAEPQCPA